MATYGDMQSEIADELNRSDLTIQIKKAILEAVRKYERERFYFNETTANDATVAGTEFYDAPTDMVYEDSIVITVGNSKSLMVKRDYAETEVVSSDSSIRGIPVEYSAYKEQFRFHPIPNDAYTFTVSYIKRFSELSSESDTNVWTTDAYDLIKNAAKRLIYTNYLRDSNNATLAMTGERSAYIYLRGETDMRVMVGHARSTNW